MVFPGGDRDMMQRYLNAMAIVQRFGKPDYFITMTCNPHWQEITKKSRAWPATTRQTRPGFKSIQGQVTIIDGFIGQEKVLWRCCSLCARHGISKKGLAA
jgi:hypothetical protein